MDTGFLLGGEENVQELEVMMISQLCEYSRRHKFYTLN